MTSPAEVVWRILRQLELTDDQSAMAEDVVPEELRRLASDDLEMGEVE